MPNVLWTSKFNEIHEVNGYAYLHLKRAGGKLVAVLPYRNKIAGGWEYLARIEICPAHSPNPEQCGITGGIGDKEPVDAAVEELKEEAGYTQEVTRFQFLGTVRPSKQSDTVAYLYAIDLTNAEQGEATTDGSPLENKGAGVAWISEGQAIYNEDVLFATALLRLKAMMSW